MSERREPVGVIGVGYVGLVTAACFAELGHHVVCRDIDALKVAALQAGEVPIHEPGLTAMVQRNRGRLHFTLDLDDVFARARIAFVCVDTPPTVSGDADLSRVQAVIEAIPDTATGAVLVMKSTVPVGTGARLRAELDLRGLSDVGYVSNPEFLREGTAISDFSNPDRVVIGAERDADGDRVGELYAGFDCPMVRTDVPSAEMVKLASNAFLATKISFINEIANVCEEVGADVGEVARGMGLDPRIGESFLRPGVGYGGSCLAGAETVLVRRRGEVRLLALEALYDELGDEAPASAVARGCIEPGGVEVLAYDPAGTAAFEAVAAATRRPYAGELLRITTAGGRDLRCTPDHPFVVADGDATAVRLAQDLRPGDRLPVAGSPVRERDGGRLTVAPSPPLRSTAAGSAVAERGALPQALEADARFWRLVGRYLSAGTTAGQRGQRTLAWVLDGAGHAGRAEEIAGFWRALELPVEVIEGATVTTVVVASPALAAWWADGLGAGRGRLDRRLPGAIWGAPVDAREALLAGLAEGVVVAGDGVLMDGLMRLGLGAGTGWDPVVAVGREPFAGPVYSLEVPGVQTFVTSGGLVTHNCFPKDVTALKQLAGNSGYHFQLLASVIEVNELQKRRVVNKLKRRLGPLRGKRVALLGLAFKPNTDDMREAASLVLAGRLVAVGASVVAFDPVAAARARPLLDPRVELAGTMREALVDADAAVIVTEWDEFRALLDPTTRELMRRPLLLDGRNLLTPESAAAAGYEYESVGRPAPEPLPAVPS